MRLISWNKVKLWNCLACGDCCKHFNVPLRSNEYAWMLKTYGSRIFNLNKSPGKIFLQRKVNGRCIFQRCINGKWICGIQGIKPIVCKLFPFSIMRSNRKKALYIYKGTPYNIYLERSCKGITLGTPSKDFIFKTIPQAIKESLHPENSPHTLTSNLVLIPHLNHF